MVVDLDAVPRGSETVGAPVGVSRASVPLVRSEQHPHCPALWVFRQARLEASAGASLLARLAHGSLVASPPEVASPTGWALRRAPKQSPPV